MLLLIALCAFLAMALFAIALERRLSARRTLLRTRVEMIARDDFSPLPAAGNRRLLRVQNYSNLPILQALLQRSPKAEKIADDLDRAAIPLRVGEYLIISVAAGLVLALLARTLVATGPLGVAIPAAAFVLGLLLPRLYVRGRIRSRRAEIEKNLPDAIEMIARGLRSGAGLLAAIESVIAQVGGALGDELERVRLEMAANLTAQEAFREMDRRVASPDLHIIVTAFLIQREVGGNLAEILDNVSNTMRERVRLRNEMRALTGEQRLSAYVIAVVPIAILAVLAMLDFELVKPMFERNLGRVMLGVAAALEIVGFLVMYSISSQFEV